MTVAISVHSLFLLSDVLMHGLITKTDEYLTCHKRVNLNVNNFMFTCDKFYKKGKKVKKCKFRKSAKKGTWFERSKLNFEDIIYMTILWLKLSHPRQHFIKNEVRCSSSTFVDWASFCREICIN